MKADFIEHPCYNPDLLNKAGRIHLPIAPDCNMQCNYCNRKYSCINESRPGVCSKIITPEESGGYLKDKLKQHTETKVIGIAGPAETLANIDILYKTFTLLKKEYSGYLYCISTNGLVLPDNIDLIKEIGIDYITITINSLNIQSIVKIYDWVKYKNKVYQKYEAAEIILNQHKLALKVLKDSKIKYKINSILIPGINEDDIKEVACQGAIFSALAQNIMPVVAVKHTKFEFCSEVSLDLLQKVRKESSKYIKVITHCQRCRADAAGLIKQQHKIAN
ncbi:MAG: radical SAM protein [Cyanobacteriota bacterium]